MGHLKECDICKKIYKVYADDITVNGVDITDVNSIIFSYYNERIQTFNLCPNCMGRIVDFINSIVKERYEFG